MSATEIIEQIKQLPPDQQQQVYDFVQHVRASGAEGVKCIPPEEFNRIADEIFRDYDNLFRKLAE